MKNGIETLTESFELPTIPSCPKDKPCMTKSGMVCNFPFTFNGNTYSQCTDIPNSKFTKKSYFGKLGCESTVDDEGIRYHPQWGPCTSGCPGVPVSSKQGHRKV